MIWRNYVTVTLCIGTFCRELCINGWNDRFAVWVLDSGGLQEAQVQSYSPGGANAPSWESTLAPPGEYNWTIRLRRRYGLMSNFFDHLFSSLMEFTVSIPSNPQQRSQQNPFGISRQIKSVYTSWIIVYAKSLSAINNGCTRPVTSFSSLIWTVPWHTAQDGNPLCL